MLTHLARQAASLVAPTLTQRYADRRYWLRQGRAFQHALSGAAGLGDKVDLALGHKQFYTAQKRAEILGLAERVHALRPARSAEIGCYAGGTLALFAQAAPPDARILSVDIQYMEFRDAAAPGFARNSQQIACLTADTHQPATVGKVMRWLAGTPLEFLFIDGDHSYEGVEADFRMYAPLVRPGGLIGFHDIVLDYRQRYGRETPADVGGVPQFWAALKAKGYAVEELIEDPDQDGMGIGIVKWDGTLR